MKPTVNDSFNPAFIRAFFNELFNAGFCFSVRQDVFYAWCAA